jgi:TetR/AcrR family transcriptional regulator, mexJK operon transcriptional repressor
MALSAVPVELPPEASSSPKRLAIVEAASKLFINQGFGAVSVDAIAAEAKVSKRTVYSHFENKDALFAGVMSGACERRGGMEGCPLSNEDVMKYAPVAELLQKTGEHVLGMITAPETVEIYRVVVGDSGRFPDLGRNFYEFGPASILKMTSAYLEAKSKSGELLIDDPVKAAKYLFGMITFPLQMEMATGMRDQVTEKEVRETVAGAVEAFLKIYSA